MMYNKKNQKKTKFTNNTKTSRSAVLKSGTEEKAVDIAFTLNANTTGAIQLLNGIAPGSGFSQRIGRKVRMWRLDGVMLNNVTAGTGVDQVQRLLIVLDRQPNGAALAITDVLTAAGTETLTNFGNSSRFKILLDRRMYLNASAEPGSAVPYGLALRLGSSIYFNAGSAGTVADIVSNSVYAISIGSIAPGATAGVCNGTVRLHYTDE